MGRFVRGEVVSLPFPFTNFRNFKKRPALVLSVLHAHEDLIVCMITSQNVSDSDALALTIADFKRGSLPKPSYIRPNRLFTVEERRVLKSLGHLSDEKMQEVITKLIEILS